MKLTLAEAAWKRLALDTVREEIAELLDQEYELVRDLETSDSPTDPLAPLAFNVIDHTTDGTISMLPLPSLEKAVAAVDGHIVDVNREMRAASQVRTIATVTQEAISRLTTAERRVLQVHPFLGGADGEPAAAAANRFNATHYGVAAPVFENPPTDAPA